MHAVESFLLGAILGGGAVAAALSTQLRAEFHSLHEKLNTLHEKADAVIQAVRGRA